MVCRKCKLILRFAHDPSSNPSPFQKGVVLLGFEKSRGYLFYHLSGHNFSRRVWIFIMNFNFFGFKKYQISKILPTGCHFSLFLHNCYFIFKKSRALTQHLVTIVVTKTINVLKCNINIHEETEGVPLFQRGGLILIIKMQSPGFQKY